MTSTLLMPRGYHRRTTAVPSATAAGSTAPTRILDLTHPRVRAAVAALGAPPSTGPTQQMPGTGPTEQTPPTVAALRRAHRWIAGAVRPVYSVDEGRPVSEVLRTGRGSCSQRMAVLEAVARSWGVPTRVRGLVVDGRFWYPRFPRLRAVVPAEVVLAWPEFRLPERTPDDGPWLPVSALFADGRTAARTGGPFTNSGPETLFEALSRTAVDWDGTASAACPGTGPCDLSAQVRADLGHFDSRDALFARHGQTLCPAARLLAEPLLSRRAAGH
ncbi:transglutaminase-like domain-containing protein [Kitasatospora sp. NPDC059646]|uniref:transglutaminase-like domain-containing protein n=1 Tax=Kitasatospora sp. NPDC059646 TaxID=3346893 RepID=UPI0036871649